MEELANGCNRDPLLFVLRHAGLALQEKLYLRSVAAGGQWPEHRLGV